MVQGKESMTRIPDKFSYVNSCDLDVNVQIKLGTLEGRRERPSYKQLIDDPMLRFSGAYQETCSDLYVSCQVHADGKPLALPVRTSYKAFSTRWNWNEWLTLPLKYSDLPRNALLCLTVWDIYGTKNAVPVGGTAVSLFGKRGTFRKGMHDLRVWPNVEVDGDEPTTTPGKCSGREDEMSRLAKLSKKHRYGHLPKVDWLDRLTFREIEMINERQKRDSNYMFLMIEFPHIHCDATELSVVYFEKGAQESFAVNTNAEVVKVPDPEIRLENLVEDKHHKLARSLRSGPTDRDLKPNALTRDQLNKIVEYPPTRNLTSEEKDLVWKFRFYLSSSKKALAKFLKSVNWNTTQEAKQALELLYRWSPMDVEDALELLSPAFAHPAVRKYAVTRLRQADDEELLLYLLQLVQALKYEDFDEIQTAYQREREASMPLMTSHRDPSVSTTTPGASPEHTQSSSPDTLPRSRSNSVTDEGETNQETLLDALGMEVDALNIQEPLQEMDLATFLISRACHNSTLANYYCWYLIVECDDQDTQTKDPRVLGMYVTVLKRFSQALNNVQHPVVSDKKQQSTFLKGPDAIMDNIGKEPAFCRQTQQGGYDCRLRRSAIAGQQVFMERLVKLVKMVARESGNRKKKMEKLQALLADPEVIRFNFANFDPLPLPLDPEVKVKGICPDDAHLFKSALMPCKFTFKTINNQEYQTLFKHGDDLRQDQLVLQIITLMDRLLRKENLDLKLTPYKVLATSSKHGFVQFIPSLSIAEILAVDGSILNFFRKHAPSETAPNGIQPEVMDNYVKSCAGYCIITYILGVGDRHLDNLLLTTSGKLFHIDFGYILGRDPKPMPPPMKLSREMVEAMGGTSSEHFMDFKKLCYTAFLHLRRSANLILNLFSLMVDANVPDIALEPDKTVKKVQDKFLLEVSDEEAVRYIQSLIDLSVSATMAALMEQMHRIAQYWRK